MGLSMQSKGKGGTPIRYFGRCWYTSFLEKGGDTLVDACIQVFWVRLSDAPSWGKFTTFLSLDIKDYIQNNIFKVVLHSPS